MKVLILGKCPDFIVPSNEVSFVESPREADLVILSEEIQSYFLGATLGQLVEESYSLRFKHGKPKVLFATESRALFNPPKIQKK